MDIEFLRGAVAQVAILVIDDATDDSASSSEDQEVDFEIYANLLQDEQPANKRIKKVENYMGIISEMSLSTFKSHFRLTRTSYEVVRNTIIPLYTARNVREGHHGIPMNKALLLAIWTLANQESFRGISDRFDVSKSNAHRHFLCICDCLLNLSNEFLHWPSANDFRNIREKFSNSRVGNGFPNVVGVVDGMHIPIPAPKDDRASYYNRKGFHSILLQGICDSELRFIDIFVGWPGSSHDGRVWRKSPIGRALADERIDLPEGTHILGDSAYPLLPYLMTPFRDNGHLTRIQNNYNVKLSSKRIFIEQAFGLLKSRFRRLRFLNMSLMNEMKSVVIGACVLHNICIAHNDDMNPQDIDAEDENEIQVDDNGNNYMTGGAADKRNDIADILYRL